MNYEHMRPDMDADRDTRFWRLDTFSDAIFAVAMTLLVFTFPPLGRPKTSDPRLFKTCFMVCRASSRRL